jgi:hypothetical protein
MEKEMGSFFPICEAIAWQIGASGINGYIFKEFPEDR